MDSIQLGLAYDKLSLLRVITWKEMEQNKELKILFKDLIFAYLQFYPLHLDKERIARNLYIMC